MRVITVRQPWAWAIVHGGKDVENRTRNIAGGYRGPVAIHAGLAMAPEAFDANALMQGQRNRRDFERGAIIGVVNLWAVHRAQPFCCPNRGAKPFGSPWAMADHWHLIFANPRPLATPIPATGRLGLWKPTTELADQIQAAIDNHQPLKRLDEKENTDE